MELTAGYPFWLINDGLPYHYPKLSANTSTQTLIIGGGISGALTAYYLTKAGIYCILVDGRSIGLGSTCASTSLLQYELDMPLHMLAARIGFQKATRAYQACGAAIDKLVALMDDIGYTAYETINSLYFSEHLSQRNFMQKECLVRQKAGFDVAFLSKEEIHQQYGLEAAWAILSQQGAAIDAYKLTHHIFQYAQPKGLQVFDRTKVTGIDYKDNRCIVTTAEGHTIKAAHIVNATGFEVVNFIKKGIVDFYCTYAVISEHTDNKEALWKDRVMMWNTEDPYLYMRLTTDNRVIVGGRDERFSNSITRETYLTKKANLLQEDFKKLFKDISFKREFAWSGTFGKTKDSLPYIGTYAATPNTYYALGFGGNGITFSVVAAQIITDILKGKRNEDAALFSFER
jgi:glycine/D-amino acid oxidase-like deaminating enzyme